VTGDIVESRFDRGMATLREIHHDAGPATLATLDAIHPDLARFVIETAFGDIYSRPGLDLKTRQIATVAALACMGTAPAQLKSHVRGALNLGWSAAEIVEVIMQMSVYGGVPAAINSALAAKDVFDERGLQAAPVAGGEGAD
jgi:4-carboxymuconolactone decarboxylase